MDDILKTILSYKISELLTVIHLIYPEDFKDIDIKESFNDIRKWISITDDPIPQPRERKEYKPRKIPTDELRCRARCWSPYDANGKQCTRKIMQDGEFLCKQHKRNLVHGIYNEPLTLVQLKNFEKHRQK